MKSEKQQAAAAADFARRWQGRGYEKGDSQVFWADLLTNVFGVESIAEFIRYEEQVKVDKTNFIDGHIPSTKVLIEQKSISKDLREPVTQSDGLRLTPFQQAKRYAAEMPYSERPRWIVTCNFREFLVYDMELPNGEPESILLEHLGREYYRLQFLVDARSEHLTKEMQVSMQAGEIVGRIYDALTARTESQKEGLADGGDYGEFLHDVNILCVRLVFCLYAEDAGIFGRRDMFHDYLRQFDAHHLRRALMDLFKVLNTPVDERDPYLEPDLAQFPYVNGGLFADQKPLPWGGDGTGLDQLRTLLLQNASLDFDWSEISPTIFGAVFESTLNPETRRSGGMHYTSIENIHKVIDPLFLNDLRSELDAILEEKVERQRVRRLEAYQDRLASLTFLDPACGSGNFLTETYLSLRRLENEAIRERYHGQAMMGAFKNPVKVSIQQFHGIEVNDFAVTVATTALWISEAQMLAETERIVQQDIDFLPLKSYHNIREGNALRTEWPKTDYIMGNPPFVGASMMTSEQKADAVTIFGKGKRVNSIDYVGAWYYRAAQLLQGTQAHAAFVSTNSITQGEQVAPFWEPLLNVYNIHIDFAYRTFRWDSEASQKAHVHCVIIGFSAAGVQYPTIYDGQQVIKASNINPYLTDAPNIVIASRPKPICDVPTISYGNKPSDGGNLILSQEERDQLVAKDASISHLVRRYVGARDFINNDEVRFCLWLKNVPPSMYRHNTEIMRRLHAVRQMRLASSAAPTRALADRPYLFFSTPQTGNPYLLIPEVSSERRKYIPIGFMPSSVIAANTVVIVADAKLFHFGILTSSIHMAWMRTVAGRLKSDYRYAGSVVYNNFPWPSPTDKQRTQIEQTAQAILDARALYPESSLADLYDDLTIPPELRRAHQQNDRAVAEAYGIPLKPTPEEGQIVAVLFRMYQALTK